MTDWIRAAGRRACVVVMAAAAWAFASGMAEATHNASAPKAPSGGSGKELLVFDLNRKVTKADKGFPWFVPPPANGNWKSPVNYAEGTYHVRVQVRSQPKAQNMRIQFCIWQDNLKLENCSSMGNVKGSPGTVVTWSLPVSKMWKKNGKVIDYSRPRQRIGAAIWNHKGPVSDFASFRWNGENPDAWYPLDMRMTVVVVAKGASFGGWDKYTK